MNKVWTIGGVLVAAAAAAYFWFSPGRSTATQAASPGASAPGAGGQGTGGAGGGAGGAPVSVTAVAAQQRDVEVQLEATGTVTAANMVEVRPQVSSVITRVHVREGQFVKAGELLFTLDTRTDAANVAKAQAQLAKDQATLADAQRQLARSRDLLAQKFISQAALDSNVALVESQSAVVASSRVAIEAARVGLGYGRITAPSAGRVGAVSVFVGTSVQANTTTLATITQLDPIFVSFNLPQRNVGDALQSLKAGGGKVTAALPEAKGTMTGRLQFVDSAVDQASGTVKVKALFDNKNQSLWPGAFVNVKLAVQTLKAAIVVPQAAVLQGPRGRAVFVIEADNKVASRPVEVGAVGRQRRRGDRAAPRRTLVVVDGRQNVRPGSRVVERPADGKRGAAASGAGPGGAGASAAGTTPAASAGNPVPQP